MVPAGSVPVHLAGVARRRPLHIRRRAPAMTSSPYSLSSGPDAWESLWMKARVRLTRRLVVAGGLGLAVAPPAMAHRSQSVLTTVTWNASATTLEVTHRMHAHDAEVGLAQSMGVESIDLTQSKNQAQLMLYVEKRFSLSD